MYHCGCISIFHTASCRVPGFLVLCSHTWRIQTGNPHPNPSRLLCDITLVLAMKYLKCSSELNIMISILSQTGMREFSVCYNIHNTLLTRVFYHVRPRLVLLPSQYPHHLDIISRLRHKGSQIRNIDDDVLLIQSLFH